MQEKGRNTSHCHKPWDDPRPCLNTLTAPLGVCNGVNPTIQPQQHRFNCNLIHFPPTIPACDENLQRFMATAPAPAAPGQHLLFPCESSLGYLRILQGKSIISSSGVSMPASHRGLLGGYSQVF